MARFMHFFLISITVTWIFCCKAIQAQQEDAPPPPNNHPQVPFRPGSGEMFDEIATTYDLLNRIISLGFDRHWRQTAIEALKISRHTSYKILDLSTGTGDLAMAITRLFPAATIVGVDPSAKMLAIAQKKYNRLIHPSSKSVMSIPPSGDASRKAESPPTFSSSSSSFSSASPGRAGKIEFLQGIAESLPFDDASFDAIVVGFGVRNFEDRIQGLAEMYRVLKPGGNAVILELGDAPDGPWGPMVDFFVSKLMPFVGGMLSGRHSAYQYLDSSMKNFPKPAQFLQILTDVGFDQIAHNRLPPFNAGPILYTAVKKN